MSTKSRTAIWGPQIQGAEISARPVRMEGYGGPAQPSPTIGQCISGGMAWLEVECNRCKTRASLPLDAIRRPRDTPLWKLEASLKCRSCRKGRWAPPVHMIKLTEQQEITPYKWVHPGRREVRAHRITRASRWCVARLAHRPKNVLNIDRMFNSQQTLAERAR